MNWLNWFRLSLATSEIGLQVTIDVLPGQLGIDGAMWLVHWDENFIVVAGCNLLEGLRIEVEVVLVRHGHRNDRHLRQDIQDLSFTQIQGVLNGGRGHAHLRIASKVTNDYVFDRLPGPEEVQVLGIGVFPGAIHHGAKDAIILIWQRSELIVHEVHERGLGRLQHPETLDARDDRLFGI